MSDLYHWTFKYNGKQWKVTAWAAGRKPVMGSNLSRRVRSQGRLMNRRTYQQFCWIGNRKLRAR